MKKTNLLQCNDLALEICPFSTLSTVPREEGKMAFPRQPFSLFFFHQFLNLALADLSLMIRWAGLPLSSFGLWT
jgi:hypothetical protein